MPDQEDGNTESDTDPESPPANKVARLIDVYGLGEEFGDRLEALWTAEGEERESLRTLAARFNRRLLEVEMTETGMSTLDGEVDNLYRLLRGDDVSSGVRTEARVRLEREGVDVERLEGDFVTYQAIRSYLKEYRGADYQHGSDSSRVDTVIETVQRLQSRVRSVAERNLQQLRDTGRLSLGEFRLFVGIEVLCEDCNEQYGLIELLKRGGCECERAASE